jgi:hypothetical protein
MLAVGRKAPEFHSALKYNPGEITLAVGQDLVCRPPKVVAQCMAHYNLLSTLPAGLVLDSFTGAITGTASEAFMRTTVFVEAVSHRGESTAISLCIEVVDFTQGEYSVGHISEHAPGVYMLILHVPEEAEAARLGAAAAPYGW